jgi:flagellar secretion chaperone FliS
MPATNPFQAYRSASVQTATPERLLIMLYDGLVGSIQIAISSIQNGEFNNANKQLIKAQNIVRELHSTLKMEYEISTSLATLYDYFHRELVKANVNKKAQVLQEILPIIKDMRDTWAQAALQVQKEKAGVNVLE